MPEKYISTTRAAALLNVKRRTLQQWVVTGHLPATKFGRDWLIKESDLRGIQPPPMGRPRKVHSCPRCGEEI